MGLPWEGFVVILAALLSTAISEGLIWLLVYRTDEFRSLIQSIDRVTLKMEKNKELAEGDKKKAKSKKAGRYEEDLRYLDRGIVQFSQKSLVASGLVTMVFYLLLSSAYAACVLACPGAFSHQLALQVRGRRCRAPPLRASPRLACPDPPGPAG